MELHIELHLERDRFIYDGPHHASLILSLVQQWLDARTARLRVEADTLAGQLQHESETLTEALDDADRP